MKIGKHRDTFFKLIAKAARDNQTLVSDHMINDLLDIWPNTPFCNPAEMLAMVMGIRKLKNQAFEAGVRCSGGLNTGESANGSPPVQP